VKERKTEKGTLMAVKVVTSGGLNCLGGAMCLKGQERNSIYIVLTKHLTFRWPKASEEYLSS